MSNIRKGTLILEEIVFTAAYQLKWIP